MNYQKFSTAFLAIAALLSWPFFATAELVGLWSFDGDANDSSGNDNNGSFEQGAELNDDER